MIESATIENFRGFAKAEVTGLRRVNLVVGDNGAGKTSLLEALWLAGEASSLVTLQLRAVRGYDPITIFDPVTIANSLWEDLFRDAGQAQDILVSLGLGDSTTRTMRVQRQRIDAPATILPLSPGTAPGQPFGLAQAASGPQFRPLEFSWSVDGQTVATSEPVVSGAGTGSIGSGEGSRIPVFYIPAWRGSFAPAIAQAFSDLSKQGREQSFIDAMKHQFPEITSITTELLVGRPMLYVGLAGRPRKLPIMAVSAGMALLALFLLIIAQEKGRIVLIDEIENGIHHSRQKRMWEQIHRFAADHDAQVFATTHSLECLEAAASVMEGKEEDFAIVRMHQETIGSSASVVPARSAIPQLRAGLEIRF